MEGAVIGELGKTMIPDGTITIGIVGFVGLLYKAYVLGKSHGKLKKDIDGLGYMARSKFEKYEERLKRMEMALLLVSKNDPETRRIVGLLANRREEGEAE